VSENSLCGDEKIISSLLKIIFSSPKNKSSDVNKTYINISNGQNYNCQPKLDQFFVGKIGTVKTRNAKECINTF
jgi:hypothetical protein